MRSGKINVLLVTVPVILVFLRIALTVDLGFHDTTIDVLIFHNIYDAEVFCFFYFGSQNGCRWHNYN